MCAVQTREGSSGLGQELGAAVGAHPAEVETFVRRRMPSGSPTPRRTRWYASRTRPDFEFVDGTVLPALGGLEVVHVPGHTPGSVCFYLKGQKVLFTGDLFVSYRDRLSRPFMGPESDFDHYLTSLARVRDIAPDVMLPGHGYPVYQDSVELVDGLLTRRAARLGARAWLRNVPRLARFGLGLWRDDDLPRTRRPSDDD